MIYEWTDGEQVVEHDHWSEPPDLPGEWRRVYSLSIGMVPGAANSPPGYVTTRKGE